MATIAAASLPGKGTASLEKACVAHDTKDRAFITVTGWALINVCRCLAKKYFQWGEIQKKTSAEVQEAIALALINNQWLEEGSNGTQDNDGDEEEDNNPDHYNLCKKCHKHRAVCICTKCGNPKPPTARKGKGRTHGAPKQTMAGCMNFCKNGCFAEHNCGYEQIKRTRGHRNAAV
jgi:hypothetical protein